MKKTLFHISFLALSLSSSSAFTHQEPHRTKIPEHHQHQHPKFQKKQRPDLKIEKNHTPEYHPKSYSHLLQMNGFSRNTLTNHFKLYEGYVKNTNRILELLNKYTHSNKSRGPEYAELKRRFGWEFAGMRLHELYFENLGGSGRLSPRSDLYRSIERQFGSFKNWREDFSATGGMRGIGWAVLYQDLRTGRLMNVWINEHDLGHIAGGVPILILDVFEHAYLLDHQLDKKAYMEAFFRNVNWEEAEKRFNAH